MSSPMRDTFLHDENEPRENETPEYKDKDLNDIPPCNNWTYEDRRNAQEIIPGLFIGPYQCSRDSKFLTENRITHIVCISDPQETAFIRPQFPGQFIYKLLQMKDSSNENLIMLLPRALEFIHYARSVQNPPGRILVHCITGITRSPAVVIAYIMLQYKLEIEDAFHYVQARRFCISVSNHFHRQLREFIPIALAQMTQSSGDYAIRDKRQATDDINPSSLKRQLT